MSKEESGSGGLLSKMVRFVRNPTVDWTDLDSIQADRESQYSKQMLKEMIERKRRNDFVRRREFDQLRKLRQRDALVGQRTEDPAGRPSFFQSSLTSPDDRAVTIKKIDEIEAQMSMQWWKSKPTGETLPQPPVTAQVPLDAAAPPSAIAFAATVPASLPMQLAPQPSAEPLFADDSMPITGFGGATASLERPPHNDPGRLGAAKQGAAPAPAVELEEFVHEPDLEEAAIRFANGDHAGAEAGLLEVLAQHAQDAVDEQFEIWMTLFDLYRATGQQDRFDTLALDFAARFSRSAPLWFSIPEQLGMASASADTPEAVLPARRDFSWNAPGAFTVQSLAALQASLVRAASPWTLAWTRLVTIDEAVLPALADAFNGWAEQKVQIVFTGAEVLVALLEAHTQSGDRDSNPDWWRLRMAVLRFMGRPDEFELVALDYCVTYEVSPPSWVAPRCAYSDASGDDASASVQPPAPPQNLLAKPHWEDATEPASLPGGNAQSKGLPTLSGHIEGDASAVLDALSALARPDAPLVVPCDRLIRIDFAAAGSVLNWAADQQSKGRVVQFQNLHRLVAVFFNVIGISEHAWVIPRKN